MEILLDSCFWECRPGSEGRSSNVQMVLLHIPVPAPVRQRRLKELAGAMLAKPPSKMSPIHQQFHC